MNLEKAYFDQNFSKHAFSFCSFINIISSYLIKLYFKATDTMNDSSITLQRYCTIAGLTPLASEWWHFNDIDAMNEIVSNSSDGNYLLSDIYSEIPSSEPLN